MPERRVALVTGGGSGIGRESALLLARFGFAVVVADIQPTGGEEAVGVIRAAGGRAEFVRVDLSDPEAVPAMIEFTVRRFGGLDLLHNNAGLMAAHADITDVGDDELRRFVDVMLIGTFTASRIAYGLMKAGGGGQIIHTSSRTAWTPLPEAPHYAAIKAAMLSLSRSLAASGAAHGIRSNAICPGAVRTGLHADAPEERTELIGRGGWITAGEIAEVVRYLVETPEANGEEILVDMHDGRTRYRRAVPIEFETFELTPNP